MTIKDKRKKFEYDINMLKLATFVAVASAMALGGVETLLENYYSENYIASIEALIGFIWLIFFVFTSKKAVEQVGNDRNTNHECYDTECDVYFYTPWMSPLDNFSAFRIEIWGEKFATSEHAYQWKKYVDVLPEVAERILNAPSPYSVKEISDAHKADVDPNFDKLSVMEEILRTKLAQHEKVREVLLETGNKQIYENSPTDEFWGVGESGNGQNHLGKLWMKLRGEL